MDNPICLECDDVAVSRSLCSIHYQRARRAGALPPKLKNPNHHSLTNIDPEARSGICSICGPTRVRVRDGNRGAECATVRRRHRKEFRRANPQSADRHRRQARLKSFYGLTGQEFEAMVASQGGACAICGEVPGYVLHVDHDHATGAVRGLLCRSCNTGIGHLKEDRQVLLSALAYLQKHK